MAGIHDVELASVQQEKEKEKDKEKEKQQGQQTVDLHAQTLSDLDSGGDEAPSPPDSPTPPAGIFLDMSFSTLSLEDEVF